MTDKPKKFVIPTYVCQWVPPESEWEECKTLEEFASHDSYASLLEHSREVADCFRRLSSDSEEYLIARCYWTIAKMREQVAMHDQEWSKEGRIHSFSIATRGTKYCERRHMNEPFPVETLCNLRDVVILGAESKADLEW